MVTKKADRHPHFENKLLYWGNEAAVLTHIKTYVIAIGPH